MKPKNCIKPTYDSCTIWSGSDMPFFGIVYGEYYDTAIVKLASIVQEWIEQDVDLKCIYTGNCDNCDTVVNIPEGLQKVIDKLCTLTTDDIENVGDLSCLGTNTISPDAAKLINRPFQINVSPTSTGATITYNYLEAIKDIPSNFSLGQIQTRTSGSPKNGSSVITDSDKTYIVSNVKSERFPLSIAAEININTPSGTVKLNRGIVIGGTQEQQINTTFNLTDFTSIDSKEFSQTDVNELVTAELCEQRSELDQLKNISVADNDCVKFPSKDIKDVVAALAGAIADICERLAKLEKVKTKGGACDGPCGTSTEESTIEEAFENVDAKNCEQDSAISELQANIETLNTTLNSFAATMSGIIPGGINNNGCTSGNC